MPKILCKCSTVIPLHDIPSPHQLLLISDVQYDQYKATIDAEQLYAEMTLIVKCPGCGRLHIFDEGPSKPAKVYKPEP